MRLVHLVTNVGHIDRIMLRQSCGCARVLREWFKQLHRHALMAHWKYEDAHADVKFVYARAC